MTSYGPMCSPGNKLMSRATQVYMWTSRQRRRAKQPRADRQPLPQDRRRRTVYDSAGKSPFTTVSVALGGGSIRKIKRTVPIRIRSPSANGANVMCVP